MRIEPDGHTVRYHYDTEERLIGVTNQRGETYLLKRDALGRVMEKVTIGGNRGATTTRSRVISSAASTSAGPSCIAPIHSAASSRSSFPTQTVPAGPGWKA